MIIILGFSPSIPCWCGLWNLSQRNMWACLKSKDQEEDRRRTCSTNLETFCRVLSLLIETGGHLLPPFETITSSNKKLLWSAKGACNGSSLTQIRMTQVTSQYHLPRLMYTGLYIGKPCPDQTLIGPTSLEEFHMARNPPWLPQVQWIPRPRYA